MALKFKKPQFNKKKWKKTRAELVKTAQVGRLHKVLGRRMIIKRVKMLRKPKSNILLAHEY